MLRLLRALGALSLGTSRPSLYLERHMERRYVLDPSESE